MSEPARCYCGSRSWERKIEERGYICCSCKSPLWQPIETAPRDNSIILLAGIDDDGNQVVGEGYWETYSWWDGEHNNPEWSWCWEADPTHWMPLPEPPKKGDE